jgi:thioredoxin 1
MPPVLQEVKRRTGERVTVLKMDIDKNPGYSRLYNILAVPTLIIFKEGHIIWRKNGVSSPHEIMEHLTSIMP